MSRSGYSDDCDNLAMWRGQVASASRGKRGQKFFRDLVAAMDAMPVKRLVAGAFEAQGEVCALGVLGKQKGADLAALEKAADNQRYDELSAAFDIARQLAQETMWINDEAGPYRGETPEARWLRVRTWAESQIREPSPTPDRGPTRG